MNRDELIKSFVEKGVSKLRADMAAIKKECAQFNERARRIL
jgi:hypothetical protein